MRVYLHVFRLACQDILEYRLDFFLVSFKYAMSIFLMATVWLAVIAQNGAETVGQSAQGIINYFVFAAVLYGFSNFHTWYVEDDIKSGQLSKFFTRPVNPLIYYFVYQLASTISEAALKLGLFLPILLWWQIPVTNSPGQIALFCLFLLPTYAFTFFFYHAISTCALWYHEVYAIRFSVMTVFRFFSGVLVPLQFLPLGLQQTLFWTPFPHVVNTPILILQGRISPELSLKSLSVLLFGQQ